MINKKLIDIKLEDLKQLVDNNVLERKTLEYKSQLPSDSDSDKKEFLGDVSSFANTIGGDIIYGIIDNGGKLGADIGFILNDSDKEIARLENMIRDGISPRLNVEIQVVGAEIDKKALIIRIKPSLEGPHRVVFRGSDKFYKRNSNGKYQMDVVELRSAFLQTSNLVDQIKKFRRTRIFDIKAADTPIPLVINESFSAVHILPFSAFSNPIIIDSKTLLALSTGKYSHVFAPVHKGAGWSHRINLDGVIAYSGGDPQKKTYAYTQLYRNGIIEGVECDVISSRMEVEEKILPMGFIESNTIQYASQMLKLLSELGFQPPYYIFLTLTNIKGFKVSEPNRSIFLDRYPINTDDLLLPEVIIENLDDSLEKKFQPVFDMIWNASGVSRSLHYDENGNYIG